MPHVFSKKLMWLLRGQLFEKFDYFLCHGLVTLLLVHFYPFVFYLALLPFFLLILIPSFAPSIMV